MKSVAIIQVRMGSTRLPGKSLMDIAGKPLIAHVVERVRAARTVNEIVIATTSAADDDPLAKFAEEQRAKVFRGSTDDVLDRFYHASVHNNADIIVRITADDPFKDPDVIDRIVDCLVQDHSLDYASNTIEPTFPEGLDVEAFRFSALARAWREAVLPSEREHVTPYIWKNPSIFRIVNVRHDVDLSKLRWTLDYEEDLRFTRAVYGKLYRGKIFRMEEILQLLSAEPSLAKINAGLVRNAGYIRSVKSERQFHQP